MGHLDTEDQTASLTLTYCPLRNIEIGWTVDTKFPVLPFFKKFKMVKPQIAFIDCPDRVKHPIQSPRCLASKLCQFQTEIEMNRS